MQLAQDLKVRLPLIAVETYTLDDYNARINLITEYFNDKYSEDEWSSHIIESGGIKYVFFVATEKGQVHMLERIKPLIEEAGDRTGFGPSSPDRSVGNTAVTLEVLTPSHPELQPDPRVLKAYDTTPDKKPTLDATA
jgi:predicted ATP-dependent Lon-type protease